MTDVGGPPVGLVLGSAVPPEQIAGLAQLGERLGYSELWLAEDYFFTGGIAGATAVLSQTARIPVGLGIVSAVVRHPALLAMEVATMERMFPGRVRPGIGLGVPAWVHQMGLMPKSQLGAMRECVTSLRRLFAGETLSERGATFEFDAVGLTHPPHQAPPIYMGVIGPKMLRLSGELADGTVGSVLGTPAYIRWAREQIDAGKADGGRTGNHRLCCFALYATDRDAAVAKQTLRRMLAFYLAAVPRSAVTDAYGIGDELWELAQGGAERIDREMPEQWLEDLVIAGDPEECAEKIDRLLQAGADSVVLFPMPVERSAEVVELTAAEVFPRLA